MSEALTAILKHLSTAAYSFVSISDIKISKYFQVVPDYRTDKIRERQVQFILIAVHMGGVSKTFLAPNFAGGVHRKAGPPYPGPAPRRPSLPLDNTVIFP